MGGGRDGVVGTLGEKVVVGILGGKGVVGIEGGVGEAGGGGGEGVGGGVGEGVTVSRGERCPSNPFIFTSKESESCFSKLRLPFLSSSSLVGNLGPTSSLMAIWTGCLEPEMDLDTSGKLSNSRFNSFR